MILFQNVHFKVMVDRYLSNSFIAVVVDTGDKLFAGVTADFSWKNLKSKISWLTPFKPLYYSIFVLESKRVCRRGEKNSSFLDFPFCRDGWCI
jgi:hypothetical protein